MLFRFRKSFLACIFVGHRGLWTHQYRPRQQVTQINDHAQNYSALTSVIHCLVGHIKKLLIKSECTLWSI